MEEKKTPQKWAHPLIKLNSNFIGSEM